MWSEQTPKVGHELRRNTGLAGSQGQQLGGEGLDLALDRCGVQACEGVFPDRLVLGADLFVSLGATMWRRGDVVLLGDLPVSYTHLRAHETVLDLVCRLLL